MLPTERAFTPPLDRVALLAFDVRVNRLVAITGVPAADAMYSELRARRLDLGAHNFGAGVAPDPAWSAKRIASWAEGVARICDDARMKTRYPDWSSASLDRFARAAWARAATAEDAAAVADVNAEVGGTAAAQWRAACITLLSSAELVLQ